MKTFKITIEEHIVQAFEIEANDIEEAMEIAENKYHSGEIVLENSEVQAKLMMAYDEEGYEVTDWVEF